MLDLYNDISPPRQDERHPLDHDGEAILPNEIRAQSVLSRVSVSESLAAVIADHAYAIPEGWRGRQ